MNIVVGEKLVQEDSWRYTKHKVLFLVSTIYDLLGWVSPLTVRGKMFIQTLWKEKMGWDQKLNPDQIKVIYDILVDLRRVTEFIFPRHILYEHIELHVFTDASIKAYGAAVYTVNDTRTQSNLLMSKARVAPCREGRLTIPKLEFCQSPANPFEKLVRQEQLLHCTSIHVHLNNHKVNVKVEVKTTIKQLNLYLVNDTIRSKGRIINSELPLDATTPLFLPNKSHLVDLFIQHIHSSRNHVGLSQTLSLYRQRCWNPKICSRIKSLLLRCVTCQRVKGRMLPRPLPPPLPSERVQWVAPFSHVGVDHMGSCTIKDTQGRKSKAYICLFVCATTRAVHLEVVENLTTTSFVMCLRSLAATKGMPTLILSDNHKTFIAGETFLLDLQLDPSVQEYLQSKNVRWKHQTPRSPWMGGHFERLVRTIKASLVTAISRKLLTLEEFSTIVKEAENIVNSRPLTYESDSTRDVPLSPSQLAWGRDLTLMPLLLQPGDPLDGDHDARATRAQHELLINALERFRKRWHNEYLLSLREKHYNRCAENPTHHLNVGKLVMVCHDNVHRIEWPLGVITAIYPDERGVIRTAEVEECGRRSL